MSKLDELIQELCPDGVEYKELGSVCGFISGFAFKAASFTAVGKPICKTTNIQNDEIVFDGMDCFNPEDYSENLDKYVIHPQDIVIGMSGTIKVGINKSAYTCYLNQRVGKFMPNQQHLENKFLYYVLCNSIERLADAVTGGSVKNLSNKDILKLSVPVPPLEVQREIVRILDNFTELTAELTTELTARKKQYEYYRDELLAAHDNALWMTLGDLGKISMCKRIMKSETAAQGDVPFFKIGTFGKEPDAYISQETFEQYKTAYSYPKKGDILISAAGTIGRTVVFDGEPAYFQDSNIVWIANDESLVLNKFLYYYYQLQPWHVSTGGTIARLYNDNIAKAKIPVFPIEEQERIVAILDKFSAFCNDVSAGLPAEIEARQKQYEYYRDKLLTFKEVGA